MQYLGGKSKIAKYIVEYLESIRLPNQIYIEPFVGGAWVFHKMKEPKIGLDIHEPLIEMYKALQEGWVPPVELREDEYKLLQVQRDASNPLTAFAGFGCSFAGKYFGGYARDTYGGGTGNYALRAKNSLAKKLEGMKDSRFFTVDFRTIKASKNQLIYCDPPYEGTTEYRDKGFNHDLFWGKMREWSKENEVIISEYKAPKDFECVLEIPTRTSIRDKTGEVINVVEKLFRLKKETN